MGSLLQCPYQRAARQHIHEVFLRYGCIPIYLKPHSRHCLYLRPQSRLCLDALGPKQLLFAYYRSLHNYQHHVKVKSRSEML